MVEFKKNYMEWDQLMQWGKLGSVAHLLLDTLFLDARGAIELDLAIMEKDDD